MNARAVPRIELVLRKVLHAGARRFEFDVAFRSEADRIVIRGPSGSGKSLLLQVMAGIVSPDAGRVRLGGRTLYDSGSGVDLPVWQRRLGFVFQDYALFPHLDVRQNIGFALSRGALNPARRTRDPRVEDWIRRLELQELAHQFPDQLSGGQRQRVAVARAVVGEPDALLLDEPFAALDPALRRELRHELAQLQRRLGIPMLLVTHDPDDVAFFGGVELALEDGRIARPPAQAADCDES